MECENHSHHEISKSQFFIATIRWRGVKKMETMRSVLCTAPGKVEILKVAVPEPELNEVLIETRAVGLCTSDVYILTGKSPDQYPVRL